MDTRLEAHIDEIFAEIPKTEKLLNIIRGIKAKANAKYMQVRDQGYSRHVAYTEVENWIMKAKVIVDQEVAKSKNAAAATVAPQAGTVNVESVNSMPAGVVERDTSALKKATAPAPVAISAPKEAKPDKLPKRGPVSNMAPNGDDLSDIFGKAKAKKVKPEKIKEAKPEKSKKDKIVPAAAEEAPAYVAPTYVEPEIDEPDYTAPAPAYAAPVYQEVPEYEESNIDEENDDEEHFSAVTEETPVKKKKAKSEKPSKAAKPAKVAVATDEVAAPVSAKSKIFGIVLVAVGGVLAVVLILKILGIF